MNRLGSLILLLLCGLFVNRSNAQQSYDFNVTTKISTQVGTNSLQPMWSYSNQWGLENMYDQANLSVYAKATAGWHTNRQISMKWCGLHDSYTTDTIVPLFSVKAGLGAQLSTEKDRMMIHEGYLTGNLWVFDYTIGLHAFTPIFSNNELSSGSYLMSNNSRPLPRVGLGLFRYWSLPFTWNLVQIRGSMFFGYIGDEGNKNFTDDVLFHEKCAYGRLGTPFVKPFVGIVHSVMMGGRLSNGSKLPLDFWNSFRGKSGSKKLFDDKFRGEVTNAAGGHQGMWDVGLDIDISNVKLTAYYQRPFADSKAQPLFFKHEDGYEAKDMTIGIDLHLANNNILKHVNVEVVKTSRQGDKVTPDAVLVDKHGKTVYIFPGDLTQDNWEEFRDEHVHDEALEGFKNKYRPVINSGDLVHCIMWYYNEGIFAYGGRTNYMSNGLYRQGWCKDGLCMGSAFFHTAATTSMYAPAGTVTSQTNLTNVRLWAVNLGFSGDITDKLSYRFKYAYSHNYGNYIDRYDGSYSWVKHENYYFGDDGLREQYLLLETQYKMKDNLTLCTQIASDFGQVYNSTSLKISATYNF